MPILKEAQREKLLEEFRQGTSLLRLSRKYGVSKQAVASLARNRGVVNRTKVLHPNAAEIAMTLHRCGLRYLDVQSVVRNVTTGKPVDKRTVYQWLRGKSTPRWEQWQQLVEFSARQDRAAEEQLAALREQAKNGDEVVVQMTRTARDAKRFGRPTVAAHHAVIRRVIDRAPAEMRIALAWQGEKVKRPFRSRPL
jgi:hypothetical protein